MPKMSPVVRQKRDNLKKDTCSKYKILTNTNRWKLKKSQKELTNTCQLKYNQVHIDEIRNLVEGRR